MATVILVRHGEAAAGFAGHHDPGLSELGKTQAEQTAKHLDSKGPLPLFSSPLRRAQETAIPLASMWGQAVTIESRVAEIPSPTADLSDRADWLAKVMAGSWHDLPPNLQKWRTDLIDCVLSATEDCVMFSHFVAINLLVGEATNDSRMVVFRPNNASMTEFTNDNGKLAIQSLGVEATTRVN